MADYSKVLTDVGLNAQLATGDGTPTKNVFEIVGQVIQAGLGLLGVIFLCLTVYAGFLWMTAQGQEEKVEKALNIIKTAVVGLIITLAAYSISTFVVGQAGNVTDTGSSTTATSGE